MKAGNSKRHDIHAVSKGSVTVPAYVYRDTRALSRRD